MKESVPTKLALGVYWRREMLAVSTTVPVVTRVPFENLRVPWEGRVTILICCIVSSGASASVKPVRKEAEVILVSTFSATGMVMFETTGT